MGMPVAGEGSYFSRFMVKFVEIAAAGAATAVSGYLVAQVGGFLGTPATARAGGGPRRCPARAR